MFAARGVPSRSRRSGPRPAESGRERGRRHAYSNSSARAGSPSAVGIVWLHRLTVRKVKGSAAVAWEQWLDCAVQATDCRAAKAGKQTGVGWSKPSRVLMAMDPKGVVHGLVRPERSCSLRPGIG